MITEATSAGVGRHVMDLCGEMVVAGHEVHLAYSEARVDEAFRAELEALGGDLKKHVVPMRRAPHPSDIHALRRLRSICAAHGPFDIVHGQSSKGGALARLLRRSSKAATLYTPHCIYTLNPSAGRIARALYGRVELWLARRTDAIIAVSPDEREHLAALGFPEERLHCVPNGVRARSWKKRAEARRDLGLPQDALVVAFLARLSAQKNPILMIESFARVAQRIDKARLAFAGDGELGEACRQRARALGIEDRVHWLGYRRAHDVMPAADVFALSSRYEGMPYVYLEALSCGLPIVSTEVGGSSLAVEEGHNGYVTQLDDSEAFAAAIARILESPKRRDEMAAASKDRAQTFDVSRMFETTMRVYEAARLPRAGREACHA